MYIFSRTQTFAKLFFVVSFTGLFMYVALAFYSFHTAFSTVSEIVEIPDKLWTASGRRFREDIKHILMWTANNNTRDIEKEAPFLKNYCGRVNCYITTNNNYLNNDYMNFDVIVFNVSHLGNWKDNVLPKHRSLHQKYVFYANEAASKYPICNGNLDNFFNWTWTYKFGSDIFSPFIEVRDKAGAVVAPKLNVKWMNNTDYSTKVGDNIEEVNTKTIAVVWIMKDCEPDPANVISINKFSEALKRHSLVLDVYGCDNKACPEDGCLEAIKRDYFFYLTYEKSFSEDYVTDEVLVAYEYDAVPIVIGSADYTKFLPHGSYIHFEVSNEDYIANLIAYAVRNSSRYRKYFNWKKLYTIHKADENNGWCQLCHLLNNDMMFKKFSTWSNFRQWWNKGPACLSKIPNPSKGF